MRWTATVWPITYEDIAPWYSYVEKFAGISGQAEGLPHLPDGEFQPPMEMYALEKTIQKRLASKAPDLTMTMGRTANLTRDLNGRAACHYCGPCSRGCSTRSYFSSHNVTLPAAEATGNMTLLANAVVERLNHDPVSGKVASVSVVDSQTRERKQYTAKIFFLCASTVGSTQILLNSRSVANPNGLANASGALGHYMMDHVYGAGALGIYVDHQHEYFSGRRPNGTYIPRFRNLPGADEELGFVRGYGYQNHVIRTNWSTPISKKGFGSSYKDTLRKPGMWAWVTGGFGECLPYKNNRMYLHQNKVDRFGIPQASFEFEWGQNERTMRQDIKQQASRIHRAAGAIANFQMDDESPDGRGIHEMGTARMGADPSESVLNAHNQAHEVPNLFVTDGACMTSNSCVNPSLTYMALTARAADYASKQLAEGQI